MVSYFDDQSNYPQERGCGHSPGAGSRQVFAGRHGTRTGIAADIAAILLNGFQIVPDVSKGIGATIDYH